MAISKAELQEFLAQLPDDADVYIDEDGLSLASGEAYIEVGGDPDVEPI